MMVALRSGCQSEAVFWSALESFVEGTSPSESEQLREAQMRVAGMAGAEAELAAEGGGKAHWTQTPEARALQSKVMKAWWAAEAEKMGSGATAAEAVRVAEQKQSAPEQPALKPKKAKKVAGGGAEAPKEHRPPSAWNLLVTQTVSEMKQSGWQSWTDVKGVVWPGSKRAVVKDKKGAEAEQYVYDGGEHDGKPPSPALGGMVRASYLKAQSDPAHAAKVAEKHSVGSASASPSDAEGQAPVKKSGRPKMTEEQKAAAKAKRDAKKAAEAAVVVPIQGLQGEWAEEE